jgi:cardiolipin synthase (CMP-forming)
MALIPVFASLLFYGKSEWALAVFLIAGFSDGVDGFIARRYNQQSELGTILDPIADKLLMTTAFIVLAMKGVMADVKHLPVPFWVTAAVIGRDVLIVVVAGAINIMTGFKGFKPSWPGKASTLVQVVAVTLILVAAVTGQSFFLPTVYVIVVLLAVISGVHYIFHVSKLMAENDRNSSE